jgi:hypothetical protein
MLYTSCGTSFLSRKTRCLLYRASVYRLECRLLEDVSESSARLRRELIEQLDRASLSMLLNTAEGNGKRHGPPPIRVPAPKSAPPYLCSALYSTTAFWIAAQAASGVSVPNTNESCAWKNAFTNSCGNA